MSAPLDLLVVCYSYAPASTPRAIRWGAICEELVRRGHRISVLAGTLPGLPRFEKIRGLEVHRVGELGMDSLRQRLHSGGAPVASSVPGRSGALRRGAKWAHDRIWRNVYWPDSSCLWYPQAVRTGRRLLAERNDTILVSVSLPFVGQLVGLSLYRQNPARRWLADMGDPFAFAEHAPSANPRLYAGLNRVAERSVVEGADAVTVTTETLARRFEREYPRSVGKVFVIPPVAAPLPGGGEPVFPAASAALRLVFAGTLYSGLRSPRPMLALAAGLAESLRGRRVELHILGDARDAAADIFADYHPAVDVKVHGSVPRDRAVASMMLADALVNVGNDSQYQLPSKCIEYASIGRPIINIASSDLDPSVAILADYPRAVSLWADEAGAAATAERVLGFLAQLGGGADNAAAAAFVRRFSPAAIGERYERILSGLA